MTKTYVSRSLLGAAILLALALPASRRAEAQEKAVRAYIEESTLSYAILYAARNFNALAYKQDPGENTLFELHDAWVDFWGAPNPHVQLQIPEGARACNTLPSGPDQANLTKCSNYAQGFYARVVDAFLGIDFAGSAHGTIDFGFKWRKVCPAKDVEICRVVGGFLDIWDDCNEICHQAVSYVPEFGVTRVALNTDAINDLFGAGKFIYNMLAGIIPGWTSESEAESDLQGLGVAIPASLLKGQLGTDVMAAIENDRIEAWVPLARVLGQTCGDWVCEGTETAGTCPRDCGADMWCADGTCNNGESSCSCRVDCPGTCCGDGLCEGSETSASCAADCEMAEY